MKCLPFLLSLALCAPLPARSQPVDGAVDKSPCAEDAPGYECFSKLQLWETGTRFKGKWKDEQLSHAETKVLLAGAEKKLAVRTSTAIRNLVIPPLPSENSGHSTTILVVSAGVALAVGLIVGALALAKDEPSTIVVR